MLDKVNFEKSKYSIKEIKDIHTTADPDWLANVAFLDYKTLFLDHQGRPEYKQDKDAIKRIFELQRLTALKAEERRVTLDKQIGSPQGLMSKVDNIDAKLWIIVDAATDEEAEVKATEIERTLKEVGLEDKYDQIVYGRRAFITCHRLKSNLNFETESEESSYSEAADHSTRALVPDIQSRRKSESVGRGTTTDEGRHEEEDLDDFGNIPLVGIVPKTPVHRHNTDSRLVNPSSQPLAAQASNSWQDTSTISGGSERIILRSKRKMDVLGSDNSSRSGSEDGKTVSQRVSTHELSPELEKSTTQKKNLSLRLPLDHLQRIFSVWLFFSFFATTAVRFLALIKKSQSDNFPPERSFIERFNNAFLFAFGFDGYDPINHTISSADGKTKPYSGTYLPFWLMLASFLGMPSRAECVVNGVPQFSGWQLLRNFFGVWIPVKETLSNQDGTLSFYQYRWTEKKIVQGLVLFFKLTLVFPIKLILIPFKILLNCLKLVTEIFLPMISLYTSIINADSIVGLIKHSYKLTENRVLSGLLIFIGMIPLGVMAIIQYAMLWACRLGLALTSPEKSARLAFVLGHGLVVGEKDSKGQRLVSNLVGGFGAIVSLALSAVLWTITLPLAIGALVTAIPSLLSAVAWISQLPFVASSLMWLSQWPLFTNLVVLVKSIVGTVSAGLVIAFGPVITTLATVMSIQIPAAVLAVGSVIGMLVIPVAAVLSWVADKLSNVWASWVEQHPFASLGRLLSFTDRKSKKSENNVELVSAPKTIAVYQAQPGGELIISQNALHLKDQSDKILNAIEVRDDKAEALYLRAKYNKDYNLIHEGARFPTQEEVNAPVDRPVAVF